MLWWVWTTPLWPLESSCRWLIELQARLHPNRCCLSEEPVPTLGFTTRSQVAHDPDPGEPHHRRARQHLRYNDWRPLCVLLHSVARSEQWRMPSVQSVPLRLLQEALIQSNNSMKSGPYEAFRVFQRHGCRIRSRLHDIDPVRRQMQSRCISACEADRGKLCILRRCSLLYLYTIM